MGTPTYTSAPQRRTVTMPPVFILYGQFEGEQLEIIDSIVIDQKNVLANLSNDYIHKITNYIITTTACKPVKSNNLIEISHIETKSRTEVKIRKI